jgi:hypothetical protein
MLLAMPIAFQEMVFAGYLIARGLRVDIRPPSLTQDPQVQPAGASNLAVYGPLPGAHSGRQGA